MAVGDNFAVGFGIIGAVAIIRFRTLISDPRNIIFMFAGISIGIATGVYGYSIAIAGSLIFSLVAFLLSFSSFGKYPETQYEVVIDLDLEKPLDFPDSEISKFCEKYDVVMQRDTEALMRKRYLVKLRKGVKSEDVYSGLKEVDGIQTVRIDKSETRIRL